MIKYRVAKVMKIQGINGKVFKAGEIVTEDCFPKGNAKILEIDGKLVKVSGKETTTEEPEVKSSLEKTDITNKFKKVKSEE